MNQSMIMLTDIELPGSVKAWLSSHHTVEAIGALDALFQLKEAKLRGTKDITEEEVESSIKVLRVILEEHQAQLVNEPMVFPPLGVPASVFESLSNAEPVPSQPESVATNDKERSDD